MPIDNFIDNETRSILQSTDYLERPRLHALLKNAIDCPLIIVCAGSGYGKTRAVHSFVKKYEAQSASKNRTADSQIPLFMESDSLNPQAEEKNAYMTWLQISVRDNIATRFWESYTNQISLISPKSGKHLKEIGFPESDDARSKCDKIRQEIAALPGKHIRVFDDFHLLRNPAVLRFLEWMVNIPLSNLTVILISRTMPEINLIGMMMRGSVYTIQEDELRFTEDEIAGYFIQHKLPVTRENIKNIYDDTQGWAFAINLIRHSIAKKQKYERHALEAMKRNIIRFIETEISQTVKDPLWHFLLRVSLIDHLAAGLIKTLAIKVTAGTAICADELIREMELLNAYIRYDFIIDTYMIHHLFLDYLRQKQDQILTDDERIETFQAAGVWCDTNGFHLDALSYYEKSADYNAIIHKIASLNVLIPQDMARYALEIFDRMPDAVKSDNPIFPSMYLKLKINLGQFEEAQIFAEKHEKDYMARPETAERNRALAAIYTFWGLLRMKMCTYNDVYDFDIYYKNLSEYFNKNPFKFIGSYKPITAGAWVSNVGTSRPGAMEEYIAAVSRMITFVYHSPSAHPQSEASKALIGFYYGLEDLLWGELYFYKRRFNDAEQFLRQSVARAREHDQYVTQNRALVYLMYIDFSSGNFSDATARLKEMESLLDEKDYGIRYTLYDIARGFYHLALDKCEQIPEWLKGGFTPYSHPSFLENYANRVRARYHYQTHQYHALLAFIENTMNHPVVLFGRIEMQVLKALSLYQLKKKSEAIAAFTEAYLLSESNKITASFTEFAKDMRTLTLAVQKDSVIQYNAINGAICPIPKKWLQDINCISSIYAKRKVKMISEYSLAYNPDDRIALKEKEIAILKDLAGGLSRTEIASNRNISVSDLKMIVGVIFNNLGVFNLPEAIRTAVDHKII